MNPNRLTILGVVAIALVLVGLPAGYVHYREANLRNFRVVSPGVLYRSGQLSILGLQRIVHDHGIRTVVSLRDSDSPDLPPPDLKEEEYCLEKDINYVRITPKSWWPEYDGPAPAEQGVKTFLKVMDDPANFPVLIHCFAGVHRTGAMVAIYRMEFDGWNNAEALAELRDGGYKNLDNEMDVLTFLEEYRPRRAR